MEEGAEGWEGAGANFASWFRLVKPYRRKLREMLIWVRRDGGNELNAEEQADGRVIEKEWRTKPA